MEAIAAKPLTQITLTTSKMKLSLIANTTVTLVVGLLLAGGMSKANKRVTRRAVRGSSSTAAHPASTNASRTLMKGKDNVTLTKVPIISLLDRHDKEELVASGTFTAVAICDDWDRVKIELTIQNTDTGKSFYCIFFQ